ncbi:hypothetical protein UFOVP28_49 [uncultured Caudovirales phage]|uniref:Uncharacterized protein n=1 Tax=uncultured Caudovirales phage TaxID=2100421 RepID=A0A6J5KNT2_9CAUD|nr:hypothetical protein UFOVP28_49 [uncultured Caudovirales phage]
MLYSDLYQAVQAYTENTEPTFLANIPLFVRLAEEDIYRKASFPLQTKVATLTLTPGVYTATLPDDFLNFEFINVVDGSGNYNLMLNKEIDYIFQVWSTAGYRGMPIHYNLRDPYTIVVGPTPDQAYVVNYQYACVPQSIVDAGSTGTWIGDNAQNCLLYGTLVQAYTYMKGEDSLLAQYQTLFLDSLKDAKDLGEGKDRSDEYRNPPPRDLPMGRQ